MKRKDAKEHSSAYKVRFRAENTMVSFKEFSNGTLGKIWYCTCVIESHSYKVNY